MPFLCDEKKLDIEEISWKEIAHIVKAINAPLHNMIETLPVTSKYKLYKSRYRYGDPIITRGNLELPIQGGGTVNLKDENVPSILKRQLGYKTVPMGLILTKSIEVFFETKRYVIPSKIFTPGKIFGLWEAFDPTPPESLVNIWNLTAGARTICMLPSISDAILYKKLQREFNLNMTSAPNRLVMHHKLFSELSKHIDIKQQQWFCEVLFLGEEWLTSNASFQNFENYLLKQAWMQSYNCRSKMEDFNEEITERNWKPKPYNIAIIKHLLAIGDGIYPAFVPAKNDENAPVSFIQDCIVNNYLLKDYAPIIMQPEHMSSVEQTHYFSLSIPTQLEHLDKGRKNDTIVNNLVEIKRMMDLLLSMKHSNIKCEFFHCDENLSGIIYPSSKIIENATPGTWDIPGYKQRKFPERSQFFKGCISIKKIN